MSRIKFLCLVGMALCQDCISLKGSKSCQNMDNYAVLPSAEFSNIATLDILLEGGKFSNDTFISDFKSAFYCPGFNGKGGRYGFSSYCAFLVSASKSQCEKQYARTTLPLVLCASTCKAHMDSIKQLFSNSTVCSSSPPSAAYDRRSSATEPSTNPLNIAQFCTDLQNEENSLDPAKCFMATGNEIQNCGFLFAEEASDYCEKNVADSCCSLVKATFPGTSVLDPVNNTFVIAGIFAAALLFIGIIYIFFQRMSKQCQRPTTKYEPNRESRFTSFFKSSDLALSFPSSINLGGARRSSLFTTIRASQILPISNLSSKFDQQPNYTINELNHEVLVFDDYDAEMEDEMACSIGDIIVLKKEFDDGWAIGINLASGDEGVFPMAICKPIGTEEKRRPRSELSIRIQSLLLQAKY